MMALGIVLVVVGLILAFTNVIGLDQNTFATSRPG